MIRMTSVGLCIVAVFAMSALVAESASAEAPEYGRCEAKAGGKYENKGCTKEKAGKVKFEWVPGPGPKAKFTTKSKEGTLVTFETTKGLHKVVCTGQTSTGEVTGPKTTAKVVETFTGCEWGPVKCNTTGKPEGTVVTTTLSGALGIVKKGETPLHNKIGNELSPTTGSTVAEFSCAGAVVLIIGHIIEPGPSLNSMKVTTTRKLTGKKGKQKPEKFEGGSLAILEGSFKKGPIELTSLGFTTIQTNEEAIEVNSVV
jgi:hypothetical protein